MREWATGANRDDEEGKLDFEGALSPVVLWEFVRYMERHSHLPDGSVRDAGNWKRGFPVPVIMKSLMRHIFDLWLLHQEGSAVRPEDGHEVDWNDALGGALFNIMALWHEHIKGAGAEQRPS